ncbi:MAG: helix-turn-helix domain-containing protein [Mycobacterium sp.]
MSAGYRESVAPRSTRRTQAERREATVTALVETARELFARDGFTATSLDAVAAKVNVTKGAVYHHFDSKQQLFEAGFAGEVARLASLLPTVFARKRDPWDGFEAACRAFLEECLDPAVQRIVLLDAPAAIGWETMRRLEAPLFAMMESAITQAVEAGRIARRPAGPLAHFLFGALCEMAMVVARAEEQKAAHRQAVTELGRVMAGLAASK